ncbi:helix-turn-helix transcriptional regulator [Devosia lacusdianchii]|jgi:predicted DNA-binding transcriptional regulator YafY|uniref:helix-turn-helix transcriptional regulator n=1 Tax=Devosia lacusdianchii TaxID=2917991 RepID=UPI001F0578DC|nr:YafY family protein [Devosia sp. JXJ CY 41]
MAKRSERLLALMQALRRRRRPVTGQVLADEMGVSLRSLYRDIDTLKSMGAAIDGEAGLGFQLRADYFLPPLMFTEEEVEAVVLGLRTLIYGPDGEMSATARDASAKLAAVLSPERRQDMDAVGLFVMPRSVGGDDFRLGQLRRALRQEQQISIRYHDAEGSPTGRTIYPLALGYYENRQVLVAWCTLRQDWRRFRIERIDGIDVLDAKLPEPRRTLFHRWRTSLGLPDLS